MTPLFPAQRAAEEFDQALGGTADAAVRERYAALLDTVEVLETQHEVLPRAEFATDLRSRLMTAAEAEFTRTPSVVRHLETARQVKQRRLGAVAASLVIVGGGAGMAAAASGSLPGEALYPVKRGLEEVGTAVRLTDTQRGEALLGRAATRLDEIGALQSRSAADPELVAATLASFRDAADSGSAHLFEAFTADGDAAVVSTVRTFTTEQMAVLQALSASADAGTLELLREAADTVAVIDQQARTLCGGCGPEASVLPPSVLAASAVSVDNLLARPVAQAQTDIAAAAAAAEAARLAALKAAAQQAEKKADELPLPGTPQAPTTGTTTQGTPVTSTLTRTGELVPSVTTGGAAVKDLVSGVTGNLSGAITDTTDTAAKIDPKTGTPLDGTAEDLTGKIDDTTGKLLP